MTRRASLPAALLALGLIAAALHLFEGPSAGAWAWRLYLAGLGMLLLSAWPWRGSGTGPPRPSRREWAALALLLVLGAAFRLHRLTTAPYGTWFDEAQNVLEAQSILDDAGYRPVFVAGLSEMPALPFYLYAPFVKLLGPTVLAVRVVSTLAGLAALLAVWALGREMFGPRVGIGAAAVLAVSRWHVGFSRFGMAHVFAVLVPPLVLLLFLRSLRRGSPRAAVAAGLALGLGVQLYYSMLALPLVLVLLVLWGLAVGRYRRRDAVLLAWALLAFVCAAAPLLQYGLRHTHEYGQRFREASIVRSAPRQQQTGSLLARSLVKHARMFHLEGDPNGRHNLPGAPMLDRVTGLLFAIGFVWCLARLREPRHALLLLWLGAMLAAGVLSVEFEAPQGARTLGAVAVVALMAALPLAWVSTHLKPAPLGGAVAALALGVAAVSSWRTYFDKQLWDAAAWASWSTPETKIGQVVRDEGGDAQVYVPAELLGGPTERLILGHALEAHAFERGRDLPLAPSGRKALVFFAGHELETATLLRRYYPGALLEPFGPPRPDGSQGDPILWIARVPAREIAALSGWVVEIAGDPDGPRPTRSTAWGWDESTVSPPFQARVRGTLRIARDGVHRLVVTSDAEAGLSLDGERLLSGTGRQGAEALLARGNHEIEIGVDVRRRGSRTSLAWTTPDSDREEPIPPERLYAPQVPAGGLLGSYYRDAAFRGEPAFRQIDPQVGFYFHALPLPRPFSVSWSGRIHASVSGSYTFATTSVDSSTVLLDGRAVVENTLTNASVEGTVTLESGWHPIQVRYQARNDYSQIYLYWTPPGGARELLPQDVLRPPGPSGLTGPRPDEAPPPRDAVAGPEGGVTIVGSPPLGTTGALRLAGGPDGLLRVLLPGSGSVESVSPEGSLGTRTLLGPSVKDPTDLAVGPDGRVYLLDAAGWVRVFSGNTPRTSIDLHPLGVYNPRGLALARNGDLLLADTGGGRILVCDPSGRLLRTVGRLGSGRGELIDPMDVAEDGGGSLVVVDSGNQRIQRFAPDGSASSVWPRTGCRSGLLSPRVDVDPAGAVWVAGGESDEIWRVDSAGTLTVFRGAPGLRAAGLSAGTSGRLFLLAQAPDRLLEARLP